MYQLADKIKDAAPYDPMKGNYKICLDSNESFFNLNEMIGGKLADAFGALSLNRYPDPLAKPAVLPFADYYGVSPDLVTAGNGSDELISVISSCFLEKGDKILVLSPDFSMYAFYGGLYELDVVALRKGAGLAADLDAAAEYINGNDVKAFIFSNPCSPTSLGVEKADVTRFLESVDCLVVIDEAYMDFWDASLLDAVSEYDNLIILKTCSKAIGLAAVRLGFAVAGVKLTNVLRAVKSPYNTDSVSQIVGGAALSEKALLRDMRDEIIKSRESLQKGAEGLAAKYPALLKVYDSKTNFVYIEASCARRLHTELLEKSVSVRLLGDALRVTAGSAGENAVFLAETEQILKGIV
jgi:histidinol-phosphate aminotransferase